MSEALASWRVEGEHSVSLPFFSFKAVGWRVSGVDGWVVWMVCCSVVFGREVCWMIDWFISLVLQVNWVFA